MFSVIYSDYYYSKIIPLLLSPNLNYQCIPISDVRSLKQFTGVLLLCEPTPEIQSLLMLFSGFKIAIGISQSSLYNYFYTHDYNDDTHAFIPDLRLLGSTPANNKIDQKRGVIFENGRPLEILEPLKVQLGTIMTYPKIVNRFEDLVAITSTVPWAICLNYQSLLACIVTRTVIYPMTSSKRSQAFLEQIGLCSYNYSPGTSVLKWYQFVNDHRDHILQRMDRFHKQSLFLFHKHPINRIVALQIHDSRVIVFNLLHHTDDYWNGARLLASFILNDPKSVSVPIIHAQLSDPSKSLIDRVYLSTNELLRKRVLSTNQENQESVMTYLKDQAPQLFTNNLKFDDDLHRTFVGWDTYMIYRGLIPYTNWWCGMVHDDCEALFEKTEFMQSLHRCRFIGVFCQKSAKTLRSYLKVYSPHTKIYVFSR